MHKLHYLLFYLFFAHASRRRDKCMSRNCNYRSPTNYSSSTEQYICSWKGFRDQKILIFLYYQTFTLLLHHFSSFLSLTFSLFHTHTPTTTPPHPHSYVLTLCPPSCHVVCIMFHSYDCLIALYFYAFHLLMRGSLNVACNWGFMALLFLFVYLSFLNLD